jgi:hypothetical protein
MKYLKIQNNGELDIRLVALMGGTTKANDRFKIGQFGTGLKYTLAFLFRKNLSFKIFSGEQQINLSIQKETIKEDVFEIVCINENRTSITTKMGLEWSAWMIIRELWCNALDEGGELKEEVYSEDEFLIGEAGKTTFFIQISDEIQEVLDNWGNYFAHGNNKIFESEEHCIYPGGDKLRLYKNGVLIYQNPDVKSLFSYDIKNAEINELREFKGSVSLEVFEALRNPNEDVISIFLSEVKEHHYEGSQLDYDWFTSFASIWQKTIGEKKVYYKSYSDGESAGFENAENMANVINLPKKVYKALTKQFEGIGAVGFSDNKVEFFEVPNVAVSQKIESLLLVLIDAGYVYDTEIKFVTGLFQDKTTLMGTGKKNKKVLVSNNILTGSFEDEKLISLLIKNIELVKVQPENFEARILELYTQNLLKNYVNQL